MSVATGSDDEVSTRDPQLTQPDVAHDFGLVRTDRSSIVLYTAHRDLKPNTKIVVVGSDIVLYVTMATAGVKQVLPTVHIGSLPVVTYFVGIFSNSIDPELIENRVVKLSPAADGRPMSSLSHSSCTSAEGIHHSVWSTEKAGRIRLWSAYQQLGYDVEPTCSDDEFAE